MDNVIIVTITAGSRSDASIISPGLLLASVRVNNTYSTQTEVSEVKNFAENADLLAVGGGGGTTRDGWGLRGADVGVVRCGGLFWQWGRLLHHYVGVTGICRRGGINIKNDVQSKSLTNMRDSPPPPSPHKHCKAQVQVKSRSCSCCSLRTSHSVRGNGTLSGCEATGFVTTHPTVCWSRWLPSENARLFIHAGHYSLNSLLEGMVLPEDLIVIEDGTP